MNLEETIDEIVKGSVFTKQYLHNSYDVNFETLFRYMDAKKIDSLSFVVDEDYFGGLTVELSIEKNEIKFTLTDNAVVNNKIVYGDCFDLSTSTDKPYIIMNYDITAYKKADLKKIEWGIASLTPSLIIDNTIHRRRDGLKIGDEIKIFNKKFQIANIDGECVTIKSLDGFSLVCEFYCDYSINEILLQGLLIRPEDNGLDCDPVIVYKYRE